ncbi:MAG: alanine racemase [Candidatus Omnitrophota bacterium]|nr:alanine racemase [Candidatus Omnitrophota bacterium]
MNNLLIKESKLYRPTWAEINLSAIDYNLKLVKKIVGPRVKVLAVVKSDAYGHGMLRVAHRIVKEIDFLGVASIDEAVCLRKSGIKKPLLIFESTFASHTKAIIDYDITPTVCSLDLVRSLNTNATKCKKKINVHIKVDTGMGRLGIWHEHALDFIKKIRAFSYLNIEGLYTHLPCADTDRKFTLNQISKFKELINKLRQGKIHIPLCHIANSMGIIGYKESHLNMVRPGLMLYGLYPKNSLISKVKLKSALSLKSRIIFVKKIPKGRTISYGATFTTLKTTVIATIPVGYNDGYLRSLSNKSEVIIDGERYKVAGRICMDQLMVNLGDSEFKVGKVVTLLGTNKNMTISAEELSRLAKTIPYEIVCAIGNSVPRFYKT